MTNKEFVGRLLEIATRFRTVYMWGMFGGPVTESKIQEKAGQYRGHYTAAKQAKLRGMIGKGYFAFDCVGLIKSILWGWAANPNHPHGGARYQANGLLDIDANVMIDMCKDVSTDFSRIVPGCAVWLPGHIGIYVGDGRVVEATPSWADGVQTTACLNIGPIAGLRGRRWTKWGKLPWVEYVTEPVDAGIPSIVTLEGKSYPTIIRDGTTKLTIETMARMLGAQTEIPLRTFAENLGYQTNYNATTKRTNLVKK